MEKKNRNVRCELSRHCVSVSGNRISQKSSKEIVNPFTQMGFDAEPELHSSTTLTPSNFKLPRKIFSDSSTSVPRKLRSAIKKRSCQSASVTFPDVKRINHRQNAWSDHLPRGAASMAISKDEEEVAETLFALARMIPFDGVHVKNRMDNKSLESKTPDLSKKQHSDSKHSSEDPMVLKEETESIPTPIAASSERDTLPARALIKSPPLIWSKLSEKRQLNLNLEVSVPPGHFQIPPLLRACDDRQLPNSTSLCGSTEQARENGLDESNPEKRGSHFNIRVANLATSEDKEPITSTGCRDNDWTSQSALHGSGVGALPLQSSAANLSSRLNITSSPKPASYDDTSSAGKISCSINGGRKSWRRCVAHVYISRLIQVLQNSEGKDIWPLDTSQSRPLQTSFAGHVAGYRNDLNETLAADKMFCSSGYKNICETANDVPVLLKTCQAEEEGHLLSGCGDSKKQSYDFLSLSTGAGTEVNSSENRPGITLEGKGHVLQMHSGARNTTYVPSILCQNRFPSITYRDQVARVSGTPPSKPPQVHIQVPSYFSNRCGPAPPSSTRATQQPYPKQQQQIWTAQLAAQFAPGPVLSSHGANWHNNRRNWDPHSTNHIQAYQKAPHPSREIIGSKHLYISQQPQQQLFGICPSFPTSTANLQNSQIPSICEDKGGRLHPDGVLPLQLLCNERLLS